MRRRRNITVRDSSPADIEELTSIAQNQKEYSEEKINVIKRRIDLIDKSIETLRDDFISFMTSNGLDLDYTIMGEVTSDQVVPDTVPDDAMEAIPIEDAMIPSLTHTTFLSVTNILLDKYPTFQDEIEEYIDALKRKRLDKAKLEDRLNGVKKSIQEYEDKISENKIVYNDSIDNLNKIKSLYQNLLDFKYLFVTLPNAFTAESYIKFQNNYLNRYSTVYYEKKNLIAKFSDILQEEYTITPIDQMEQGFYTTVFKDISIYFTETESEDGLKDKYVDTIPNKDKVIKKLDNFSISLNKLILNIKMTLDNLRGVTGVGNSVVDGLVSSTNEIAKSFVGRKKIEHTTLKSIKSTNYSTNLSVNQQIEEVKNKLQLGVENLDEKFMRASNKHLRKIALRIGFPVKYIYDRTTNLEDHVREKVRQKFGGDIPFCDESVLINSEGKRTFVKKSDIDPKTGKTKIEYQTDILEKNTRTDHDIMRA